MKRFPLSSLCIFILPFIALLAGCGGVHGITAGPDQSAQMAARVCQAYQMQDVDQLVLLAPGRKDLKRLRDAAGTPEGAENLRFAKLPSAGAIADSIGVYWKRNLPAAADWKQVELAKMEPGHVIEVKGLPVQWQPIRMTLDAKGSTFSRKLTLMTFQGRCFLMSLEPLAE